MVLMSPVTNGTGPWLVRLVIRASASARPAKNCFRTEDATTGHIATSPAPLELGVINYRRAVRQPVAHGSRGAFCVEHYDGDGLSVSATNRDYLRRILPRSPAPATGPARPTAG
jgi:hypothetical protein